MVAHDAARFLEMGDGEGDGVFQRLKVVDNDAEVRLHPGYVLGPGVHLDVQEPIRPVRRQHGKGDGLVRADFKVPFQRVGGLVGGAEGLYVHLLSSPTASKPGCNCVLQVSQIALAVSGQRGSPMPKYRFSSRCVQWYRGLPGIR